MSFLPKNTYLGNLEIFETYEYYDKPCFFACRNRAGHLFLALWVDETTDFDRWLYTPISSERLNQLKSGDIEMRNAFTQAEDGLVLDVNIFSDDRPSSIQVKTCLDLTNDLLPVEGEFLNYDVASALPGD